MEDDVINISNDTYKEHMQELDRIHSCPCSKCPSQDGCPTPAYCEPYKQWKKRKKRGNKSKIPQR